MARNQQATQTAHLLTVAKGLCPVLFVGMVPVNEAKMPFLDCFYFNHADQYRYKEMIKQACGQAEIPYLDLFDFWQSRGLDWIHSHLMEDGLHPNVAGYKALLDDVLNWPDLHQALQTADYSLERLN